MARSHQIAILSDVHYAGPDEFARGNDYEFRDLTNPLMRVFVKLYRHYIWLREPLGQNQRLDDFIARAGSPDWVIANGDYNCDTNFVGLSDDASLQSARVCLDKLRQKFGPKVRAVLGDHDLGKLSLFGGRGGMRLESLRRARKELDLQTTWRLDLSNYVVAGVTSSLIALPLFAPDILPEELAEWQRLSAEHFAEIHTLFNRLKPNQRLVLFCHDPSALPFLWRDEIVRGKLPQVELTIIGHLHSNLVFRNSRILSGLPPIHFLGHTGRRISTALSEARHWRPFNVRLCPLIGRSGIIERRRLLHVGIGRTTPARFEFHRIKR